MLRPKVYERLAQSPVHLRKVVAKVVNQSQDALPGFRENVWSIIDDARDCLDRNIGLFSNIFDDIMSSPDHVLYLEIHGELLRLQKLPLVQD